MASPFGGIVKHCHLMLRLHLVGFFIPLHKLLLILRIRIFLTLAQPMQYRSVLSSDTYKARSTYIFGDTT